MIKKAIAWTLCVNLFTYFGCLAQTEQLIETEIENVTVYLNGASVLRKQQVNLVPGRNYFKINGLSSKLDPKSLHLSLSGDAKLVSFYFEKDILQKKSNLSALASWNDSLTFFEYSLQKLRYELEAYTLEKELLTQNTERIGENDGVKTSELAAATAYYRTKVKEVNKMILEYQTKIRPVENKIVLAKKKLNAFRNDQNEVDCFRLVFIVNSSSKINSSLSLRYFVKEVGWAPKYDIRTKGVGSPIELDYRAQLFNLSGEDWQDIHLTLSTAMPNTTMEKPQMEVWGLSYSYGYAGKVRKSETSGNEGLLNTQVMRKDVQNDTLESKRKPTLQNVEVNISDISVDFVIKDTYTILSDGRPHVVDVNSYQMEASYYYFSIPKTIQEVYLMGKMTGWESLNLLEGNANVYLDGTFVGQSYIDTRYSNDTLEIVLGVDKKVNIQRVKKVDFNQKKMIGLNRRESFTYEINVRNTHALPISIEIQDQVPVAQEGDIEVEVLEFSEAEKDEVSGRLKWKFQLQPTETKALKISFSVKYPRNKFVLIRQSRRAQLNCPSDFW